MKNLKEFEALIERYDSITREEILDAEKKVGLGYPPFKRIATELTGYGSLTTCTLCVAVSCVCSNCVWYGNLGCSHRVSSYPTYIGIAYAENTDQLLSAFKARAAFMREYLTRLKQKQYEKPERV